MSTGVIFILGKGVIPILASGVKSTWPQGASAPGFSNSETGQKWGKYTFPWPVFGYIRIFTP